MDYFGNPYFLTDLIVNWLTDGVFLLDPLLRVLSTILFLFHGFHPWLFIGWTRRAGPEHH
jgi:hypothetical protein